MSANVQAVEDLLRALAPFETAESFDNVGLLIGRRDAPVSRVLVALDVTMDVVLEAEKLGAELIVSHHPLFFHARRHLVEEDAEAKVICAMVRKNLSLISAHTNLDQTEFSGSACCARLLGLQNIRREGYLFFGELPHPLKAEALCAEVSDVLNVQARLYGKGEQEITTLAIAGGAYDEGWEDAMHGGAQALLTGEVRHHNAIAASMNGFCLLDGGHYATEAPLVPALAEYLQNQFHAVQYKIRVYPSQSAPFGGV